MNYDPETEEMDEEERLESFSHYSSRKPKWPYDYPDEEDQENREEGCSLVENTE